MLATFLNRVMLAALIGLFGMGAASGACLATGHPWVALFAALMAAVLFCPTYKVIYHANEVTARVCLEMHRRGEL